MKKKIISILMCGVIILGVSGFNVTAFADDNNTSATQQVEPRDVENKDIMLINENDEVETINEDKVVEENIDTDKEEKEESVDKTESQVTVVENEYDDVLIYSLVYVVAILSMLGCYRTISLEKRINELEKKEEK